MTWQRSGDGMVWSIPRSIITIPDVPSPAECSAAEGTDDSARSEQIGYEAAPVITCRGPRIDDDVRSNERTLVDDHALGALVWPRTQTHTPAVLDDRDAIGPNERFRYYRY